MKIEFLKKYHPDLKNIINDYDSGGYLIWKLYPDTKVLIDPRSFPYRKFWADYIAYEHGQIGLEFLDRFSEKPNVSLVSLKNTSLWRSYLRDPRRNRYRAGLEPPTSSLCARASPTPKTRPNSCPTVTRPAQRPESIPNLPVRRGSQPL